MVPNSNIINIAVRTTCAGTWVLAWDMTQAVLGFRGLEWWFVFGFDPLVLVGRKLDGKATKPPVGGKLSDITPMSGSVPGGMLGLLFVAN